MLYVVEGCCLGIGGGSLTTLDLDTGARGQLWTRPGRSNTTVQILLRYDAVCIVCLLRCNAVCIVCLLRYDAVCIVCLLRYDAVCIVCLPHLEVEVDFRVGTTNGQV